MRAGAVPGCAQTGLGGAGAATRCFGFKGTGWGLRPRLHTTSWSAEVRSKLEHMQLTLFTCDAAAAQLDPGTGGAPVGGVRCALDSGQRCLQSILWLYV